MSEELQQLSEVARGFLQEHAGPKAFRRLRARDAPEGIDVSLWKRMVDLGWTGVAIPEAFGGYDMGPAAVALVADAMGAHLAAVPFATSAVFVAQALAESGWSEAARHLSALASGSTLVAVALDEAARHRGFEGLQTVAAPAAGGYALTGVKRNVLDVAAAHYLLVFAREGDATAAFMVPTDASGLSFETTVRIDHRRASTVKLDAVHVAAGQKVTTDDDGRLGRALELGRLAAASEMLGAARAVFEMTLAYMRDRKQFGVPIGSFQALQHRAAHVYTELSIAQAAVRKAAGVLAETPERAEAAVAVAKSKAGRVAMHAANEAIQLHGGVGVTDEFDVGLYVKRIRTLESLFGDHRYHADRYARCRGF